MRCPGFDGFLELRNLHVGEASVPIVTVLYQASDTERPQVPHGALGRSILRTRWDDQKDLCTSRESLGDVAFDHCCGVVTRAALNISLDQLNTPTALVVVDSLRVALSTRSR